MTILRDTLHGCRVVGEQLLGLKPLVRTRSRPPLELEFDIESTEYDQIDSDEFAALAPRIGPLCVEFHHRWPSRGRRGTEGAVGRLRELGFDCARRGATTNEEFSFVHTGASQDTST